MGSAHHELHRVDAAFKATSLFSKHGPKVSNSNKIIRGPTKEDMRVENQGDELNQDSNQV